MTKGKNKERYILFGQKVASDINLGGLPHHTWRGMPEILIKKKINLPSETQLKWYHHLKTPQGEIVGSFARRNRGYFIRMPDSADFLISKDGRVIYYILGPNSQLELVQASLLSYVIPFTLSLKGYEVLHASAVRVGSCAIAFIGNQGFGKSTLAAAFLQRSHFILSDDALPLRIKNNKILVIPSFPEVRLSKKGIVNFWGGAQGLNLQKAFTKKRAGIKKGYCTKILPLKAIFLLNKVRRGKKKVEITPMTMFDAWFTLLENSYRMDHLEASKMKRELESFSRVIEEVPVQRLSYSHGLSFLPQVVKAVVKAVKS